MTADIYAIPDTNTYNEDGSVNTSRRFSTPAKIIVVIAVVLAVAGYFIFDWVREPDISAYANETVQIIGLTDEAFTITPGDLVKLELVSTSATGVGMGQQGESKAGAVRAYGPRLNTFLEQYGYELADFSKIKVMCKDEYSVIIRPESLEGDPIISVANNKNPLAEEQQPMRFVIPDEDTGKWAYGIVSIEFTLL